MNQPNQDSIQQIEKFAVACKDNVGFRKFVEWLKSELAQRDKENRNKGYENTTSEAHALATILNHISPEQQSS